MYISNGENKKAKEMNSQIEEVTEMENNTYIKSIKSHLVYGI